VDQGAVLHVANLIWTDTGSGLPAGFTFDANNNSISVNTNDPAYDNTHGPFKTNFSYDVTDEFGATAPQTATITVIGPTANQPPETLSPPVPFSGSEDQQNGVAVILTGQDADGSVTSFRLVTLPANGVLFA